MTLWRSAEWLAYALGTALLLVSLGSVWRSEARAGQAHQDLPDMQLWSESRKQHYLGALSQTSQETLGLLRAPTLGLAAPVYASASELHLDRGAGVIDGMAYPHESGHIGIAGHRDGYFRVLKDIHVGDLLILETLHGERRFVVDELLIVDPEDVTHLQDTPDARLTIITCYPFYFAGPAPQRFLVRAHETESKIPDGQPSEVKVTIPS